MTRFSHLDYYDFALSLKQKARHVLEDRAVQFLATLVETAANGRRHKLQKETILWRAQLGCDFRTESEDNAIVEIPCAWGPERMVPRPDRSTEGRVNPKGIPCLYLCTDRDTAMSEIRPKIGAYVTAAQFIIRKDLTLMDCSKAEVPYAPVRDGEPESTEAEVWAYVNQAFSDPVDPTDDVADYAPTQAIAEAFRRVGYHGVMYQSKLGEGKNIALFDVSNADQGNGFLFTVSKVKFTFELADNPYYILNHYPKIREQIESRAKLSPVNKDCDGEKASRLKHQKSERKSTASGNSDH